MKILICTGIYPPAIGGPAQYAKNLKEAIEELGHEVSVSTYGTEKLFPTGIRHILFFIKILPKMLKADFCISLDTFSVGLPAALAGVVCRKKTIIRTGGDFLWEGYVERTSKKVLLKDFYQTEKNSFSTKEQIIFKLTSWALCQTHVLVFSTEWQRKIWSVPYALSSLKTVIVENFYGEKILAPKAETKVFMAGTRKLKWKNLDVLEKAFSMAKEKDPSLFLDESNYPYEEFMEEIKKCYAVILVSLGDISPNMILDAIQCNKPFILTKETGLYEKLKDVAIFVDPLNEEEIAEKIIYLSHQENYDKYLEKVKAFNYKHSWKQIAEEFLKAYD